MSRRIFPRKVTVTVTSVWRTTEDLRRHGGTVWRVPVDPTRPVTVSVLEGLRLTLIGSKGNKVRPTPSSTSTRRRPGLKTRLPMTVTPMSVRVPEEPVLGL